ncbi:MAG: hypothetical protein AAGC60_25160 [Acidobacteriota bacterium]
MQQTQQTPDAQSRQLKVKQTELHPDDSVLLEPIWLRCPNLSCAGRGVDGEGVDLIRHDKIVVRASPLSYTQYSFACTHCDQAPITLCVYHQSGQAASSTSGAATRFGKTRLGTP